MTGVTTATDLLEQVFVWLPTAFFLDFIVAGTLIAVARHRLKARAAARWAVDAQPGDRDPRKD